MTKYTVRTQTGNGYVTREVVADHFDIEDGLIYFMDDDTNWEYICSLANLIDIEGEVVGKEGVKHGETVLPREHG